jgi:acetylornithine deacetylase/succinyl-diaminopimelate desuccinylase-like protein
MKSAGLQTHMDVAANVVGRYPCKDANARTVIVGSHYDTVTNAGNTTGAWVF